MEQKLVQRCETEVDGDACKASYMLASGASRLARNRRLYHLGQLDLQRLCQSDQLKVNSFAQPNLLTEDFAQRNEPKIP